MNWIRCLLVALGLMSGDRHDERPRPEPTTMAPAPEPASTVTAPEIDPTTLTGPLVLLAAGTLILTDRRRRAARGV